MKLLYQSPQGEQMWFVEEVVVGRSYRIVDDKGNPNPQVVQHTENRVHNTAFFDGFVFENNKVYATSLLTEDPKFEVGHAPRLV